ncbi:MAG: restriction endonuclease subunit S [Clostridium sp.]
MKLIALKDVCKINMGQSPNSSNYNDYGDGMPFFQGNADFGERYPITRVWCNTPTKIAQAEDILISVRAPIGALNYAKEECCIGRGLAAITPDRNKVSQDFIYWALKGKKAELNDKGNGSTFKAISRKILEQTMIPDINFEQQHKCAENLEKIYGIIQNRRKELLALDDLIKARFVEMFGSIHESTKYPYIAVKDLTDVISGGTPSRDRSEYWYNGTIPWVKTTELQNNVIKNVDEHITESGLAGSSAKMVPIGTVLVAMYGQGKTRGMTAYLGIEASTNQACACILPSEKIDSMFMWKYFELSYDKLRSLAQGAGQPNLNGNMIKNFQVLVPPIELQKEFVSFVEQVDKSKVAVQKALDETQTLFDSLMQEYFG